MSSEGGTISQDAVVGASSSSNSSSTTRNRNTNSSSSSNCSKTINNNNGDSENSSSCEDDGDGDGGNSSISSDQQGESSDAEEWEEEEVEADEDEDEEAPAEEAVKEAEVPAQVPVKHQNNLIPAHSHATVQAPTRGVDCVWDFSRSKTPPTKDTYIIYSAGNSTLFLESLDSRSNSQHELELLDRHLTGVKVAPPTGPIWPSPSILTQGMTSMIPPLHPIPRGRPPPHTRVGDSILEQRRSPYPGARVLAKPHSPDQRKQCDTRTCHCCHHCCHHHPRGIDNPTVKGSVFQRHRLQAKHCTH